jgi:outer membrane protein OmpA-like peptidoglycan-associated protein
MLKNLMIASMLAAMTVSVSGCKTLDAYTGEEKTSSATKGGAIGATIGAVIGYVSAKDKSSRDRRKAILAGGAIGGVSGAAIGGYMDKQEAKLREQLQNSGVSVTRNGNDVVLNMPGNITFATGKSDLNPEFHSVLDSVILVVKEFDKTLIEVAGHTDSVGSEDSNRQLSYYRATSVGRYLRETGGIDFDRVMEVGRGEGSPIADNNTAEGRALNRRVELTLIPVEAKS